MATSPPTATETVGEPGEGDLGIVGHPIQSPNCDGAFVTQLASVKQQNAHPGSMRQLLEQYAGSHYLRTDLSCNSFSLADDGTGLYVIYYGPFAQPGDACAARERGPVGAYVKQLVNDGEYSGVRCE